MLNLQAGDLRLALDPETGGAIGAFTWRGVALLRPVSDARLGAQHGRAVAGYPLIPFANRVGGGRFRFGGRDYQLARNFGDDANTIHGNAWMHVWDVAESDAARARLRFAFAPEGRLEAEWPFAYSAEQVFELSQAGLRVTLHVRNTGTQAFPAGIGLHPYVARTPQTRLAFDADTLWLTGADGMPTVREAVQGASEFAQGRVLGSTEIDTCYAGWGGAATVTQPQAGVVLVLSSGPPLDHLQLYTPAGRDFIGLEPVSNMPDALGRMDDVSDHGLVVLQPGDTLTGEVSFRVHEIDVS